MSVQQLALWEEPAPETLELSFSWADGDTNKEQLERLATLLRGKIHAGPGHCFKVLSTRIEDGKVWGTCEEAWPLGKRDNTAPDEEEDEW